MTRTQDLIPIEDIRDNLVFLKDGGISMVISTSAVNFALLFETEQYAIIQSFAGFLNSLSFPIQIVIRSKRMDVTSYLVNLDKAIERQKNPKLIEMTRKYKQYVSSLIKENNVLDKKFFVCIPAGFMELGILHSITPEKIQKAVTILAPRRDHVLRQLSRIGLKAKQLNTEELVGLFYDIYNPSYEKLEDLSTPSSSQPKPKTIPEQNTELLDPQANTTAKNLTADPTSAQNTEPKSPLIEVITDPANQNSQNQKSALGNIPGVKNIAPPFVVEELIDDIWPKSQNS